MAYQWTGPLASYGKLTGDRRMFEQMGDLDTRSLPVPLRYSPTGGHSDAVDIGGITHIGLDGNPIMGQGFFLPEPIEPLVTPAIFKARAGINGPSLDMDNFRAAQRDGPDGLPYLAMRGRVMAATLVSTPAFADQRMDITGDALTAAGWVFTHLDTLEALELYTQVLIAAGINATAWQGVPVAPRDAPFKVEEAIQRIKQWAGGDQAKYAKAFLWQDPNIDPGDMRAYRLPIGDIIDGKLTMIYHAVYAGAALIQGAHGGLPSIPDADKVRLRSIIDRMYRRMSQDFDEDLEPPWDQGAKNRPLSMELDEEALQGLDAWETELANLSVKSSWNLPIADDDTTWDKGAALHALDAWAGEDMGKYGSAFLWKDSSASPVNKGSFKFPIATIIDGKLTVVPAAVRNAAARVSNSDIPPADKTSLTSTISTLMKRIHGGQAEIAERGLVAGGGALAPSRSTFDDPKLAGPTRVTVTAEGKVFGHIANWGVCHTGVGNVCVQAPKSKTGYAKFHQGTVLTSEGDLIPIGKITLGGGHADTRLGIIPASEHYDNSTTAVAIGRAGEDEHGIWFNGCTLSHVSEEKAAELRRSPLSGDWRYDSKVDNLELIAALAVNSPGFPIVSVTAGVQMTLLAAGMEFEVETAPEPVVAQPSADNRARLAAMVAADQVRRASRIAEFTPLGE